MKLSMSKSIQESKSEFGECQFHITAEKNGKWHLLTNSLRLTYAILIWSFIVVNIL